MIRKAIALSTLFLAAIPLILNAQQTLGGITGTVTDASGSAVPGAAVVVKDVDTNLQVKATAANNGTYEVLNLPVGNYSVSFTKEGFKTESHTAILVQGN